MLITFYTKGFLETTLHEFDVSVISHYFAITRISVCVKMIHLGFIYVYHYQLGTCDTVLTFE